MTIDANNNIQCEACGNTIPVARCPHCGMLPACIEEAAEKDARVIAIRADKLIGNGTYSFVDECLSALNIVEELDATNIKEPVDAIIYFIKAQNCQYERALGTRVGNEDDPELLLYNEWEKKRHNHLLTLRDNTFGTGPLHGLLC